MNKENLYMYTDQYIFTRRAVLSELFFVTLQQQPKLVQG